LCFFILLFVSVITKSSRVLLSFTHLLSVTTEFTYSVITNLHRQFTGCVLYPASVTCFQMCFSQFPLNSSRENELWQYTTIWHCDDVGRSAGSQFKARRECLWNAEMAYYLPLLCTLQYIYTLSSSSSSHTHYYYYITSWRRAKSGIVRVTLSRMDGRPSSLCRALNRILNPRARDDTFY